MACPKVSVSFNISIVLVRILTVTGYDGRSLFSKNRNVLSWRDNAIHSARRKPWLRGTGAAALKDYEPVLARRVSQIVRMILRKSDGVVNLSESFKFFSYVRSPRFIDITDRALQARFHGRHVVSARIYGNKITVSHTIFTMKFWRRI